MRWGFSDALVFAAIMTLRDMSNEKNTRLFKTQKFYQECYERIASDSQQAYEVVSEVVQKVSRRYIPSEITSGCRYLALYCFALVIEKQGRVTSEQSKIIKMYFEKMRFPFSQSAYLSAAKTGAEIGDFRKVISLTRNYVGGFWVNFFRALYKSGTQKDLQDVVDYSVSMITRFSVLGNMNSTLAERICMDFVESANYQINQVREIKMEEIDWIGVIPIPDRLEEMKKNYEDLIDNSNITDDIPKSDLLPLLELLILNCIYDVVSMSKQPEPVKLQMMNSAVTLSGIHTEEVTPKEYVEHIVNDTNLGLFYKKMFSAGPPLGSIWTVILTMGGQINKRNEAIAIINDIFSILIQLENYLDEKYNLLGIEGIAIKYMLHILQQLEDICNKKKQER